MRDRDFGPQPTERTAFQSALEARPEYETFPVPHGHLGAFRWDMMQLHRERLATGVVVQRLHTVVEAGKTNYGVIEVFKDGTRAGFVLSVLGDNMPNDFAATDNQEASVHGTLDEALTPVPNAEQPHFYIGVTDEHVIVGNNKSINPINVVALVQEPQTGITPDPLGEAHVWAPEAGVVLEALMLSQPDLD